MLLSAWLKALKKLWVTIGLCDVKSIFLNYLNDSKYDFLGKAQPILIICSYFIVQESFYVFIKFLHIVMVFLSI